MEARRRRFEELDISRDEINNIGKALQNEDFRKLFVEYCEEVNSPESKKTYQKEVTELERERGFDVSFINPEPGFVIKTSVDGTKKGFINVCKNEKVPKPSSVQAFQENNCGTQWSMPYSLAPPREDLDKLRNPCLVFDVVFHPDTLCMAEKSLTFRKLVIDSAVDAVEKNCKVKLDKENLKFPKLNFKGVQQAAVIRKKIKNHEPNPESVEFLSKVPFPSDDDTWTKVEKPSNRKGKTKSDAISKGYTVPKSVVKYRYGVDMADYTDGATARINATVPKQLIVEIDLPLLSSAANVELDVSNKSLMLVCEKPKYKLELVLPYEVMEEAGNASFNKALRKLLLTLPVKLISQPLLCINREDSGEDTDPGGLSTAELDEISDHSYSGSEGGYEILGAVNEPAYPTSSVHGLMNNVPRLLLPNFTCSFQKKTITLTLHVQNVIPSTASLSTVTNDRGIQAVFCSMGDGMFPVFYGLCVVFPEGTLLDEKSLHVDYCDNQILVRATLAENSLSLAKAELLVGTGPNDLNPQDWQQLADIETELSDLQLNKDEKQKTANREEQQDNSQSDPLIPNLTENGEAPILEVGKENVQLQEKTSEELLGGKIRGILKKRTVRSLSESNVDEYAMGLSSDGPESAPGSELCIAEEEFETGCETENEGSDRHLKKTVRFNEHIIQKTFRPNSSILGQRKKNQRKQRNKKRALERRASESENSEVESEQDRVRRLGQKSTDQQSANGGTEIGSKKRSKKKVARDVKEHKNDTEKTTNLKRTNSSDTDEDASRDETSEDYSKPTRNNSTATEYASELCSDDEEDDSQ